MDVHRNDDQYGGCGSNQAGNEGYGVKRRIGSNQRHHFYGNSSYTNTKHFWGNRQNDNESKNTQQSKQNQFIGRSGMNVYKAGVIHCDYTPYNICFTGMYCIIPLFRWCCVLIIIIIIKSLLNVGHIYIHSLYVQK